MDKKLAQDIVDRVVGNTTGSNDSLYTCLTAGDEIIGINYKDGKVYNITLNTFLYGVITLKVDPDGKLSEALVEKYYNGSKEASQS